MMTRTQIVFSTAIDMLFRSRPLILGMYRHEYEDDANPIITWNEADPFTRSEYVRRAFWAYLEISSCFHNPSVSKFDSQTGVIVASTIEIGPCQCERSIGLPSERMLKNPNIRECQRCGGET